MEIKTTIQAGQNGSKQLVNEYGDQLVCVRYRYDKKKQKRYKTIELIIDEQDWVPGIKIPADKQERLTEFYTRWGLSIAYIFRGDYRYK